MPEYFTWTESGMRPTERPFEDAWVKPVPPCLWSRDAGDSDCWDSACGEPFVFTEGAPAQDGFRFCPYCGGEIRIAEEG